MKFEDLPLSVRKSVEFEETVTESNHECPTCKKNTVERRTYGEGNYKGRWYVEHCKDKNCSYWTCGWR